MFFVSTRNPKVLCKFQDAVMNAMAEQQGGIFTPSFFTPLSYPEIERLANMSYTDCLAELVYGFGDGCIPKETLRNLCNEAYKDFNTGFGMQHKNCVGDKYFTTLTLEEGVEIANLTYGPTGCCKDYGYCFASTLINYFAKQNGVVRNVIDCSGGSSGPSVAWAVRNKEFLQGFTLLKTTKNNSVKALIAKANRDAKNIGYASVDADDNFINKIRFNVYNNTSLRELSNMVFINELNLLCVFAYLPVFFKSYVKCNSSPFSVSIPTGNMSLGMSAYFAKKLGIPIRRIILATEKNNFFYDIQDSKVALNKTDIEDGCSALHACVPTNFERLLFYLYDSNQGSVNRAMEELESNLRYKIQDKLLDKFEESFYVAQCDNQFTTRNIIYSMVREKEYYVEQHFSIAKMGYDRAVSDLGSAISTSPVVLFNTLDFRRNLDFVNSALGYDIENPNLPWAKQDVMDYSPTEISSSKTEILNYIVNALEDPEKLKQVVVKKEGDDDKK